MAELQHRQIGGGPGIAYAEIVITDDKDWGTGSYTIIFEVGVLPPKQAMMSAIASHLPQFQITVTANVTGVIAVVLGAREPTSRARIRLPLQLERARTHSLQIQFDSWQVVGALLDGNALKVMPSSDRS